MVFYIVQHFKVKCYYLGLVPKQRLINFNNCSVAPQQYRRGEECSGANLAEPLIDINGITFRDIYIQSCSGGNSHSQKCRRSNQFFSGERDFAKKLPSLIDFRPLHWGHHQLFPSETSLLLLSCILTEHLASHFYKILCIFNLFYEYLFTSHSQLCVLRGRACTESR